MLRSILFAAIIAGTLTGILFTAIQHLHVIPLIQAAERFEAGGHAQQHEHASIDHQNDHAHDEVIKRHLFTLLANVLAGISYAMLLASAIIVSKQVGLRKGLLWGGAGYLCFFVAPALGLTPKLPGTLGAPLEYQQIWWIATVISTAIGLGLLVFAKHLALKSLGLVFLAMPHVIGAPVPTQAYSSAPEQLRQDFIIATALANAAFWLILGGLSGHLLRKTGTAV